MRAHGILEVQNANTVTVAAFSLLTEDCLSPIQPSCQKFVPNSSLNFPNFPFICFNLSVILRFLRFPFLFLNNSLCFIFCLCVSFSTLRLCPTYSRLCNVYPPVSLSLSLFLSVIGGGLRRLWLVTVRWLVDSGENVCGLTDRQSPPSDTHTHTHTHTHKHTYTH